MRQRILPAREAAIILLPVTVVGLAGLLFGQRQQKGIQDSIGPWRTAVTSKQDIPLSQLELWQGYDRKVRLTFAALGVEPAPPSLDPNQLGWGLKTNLGVIAQGRRLRSVLATRFNSIDQFDTSRTAKIISYEIKKPEVDILIDTDDLTTRGLSLRGEAFFYWRPFGGTPRGPRSQPIDIFPYLNLTKG